MNHTILSALQHLCSKKPVRAVCISDEEWTLVIFLFVMQKIFYANEKWKKTTPQLLEKELLQRDFFAASISGALSIETEQFGEKENKLYHEIETNPLVWISSKTSLKEDSLYIIQKPKPWERLSQAQDAVRFLLQYMKTPLVEKAVFLLAQKAISSPSSFSTEMEKYHTFASYGVVRDEDLGALIETEETSSLWTLFDAFVTRKKQLFFEELTRVEKESHPLQIIRFMRTQYELLLRMSEGDSHPKFKTQEKQVASIRERSMAEKSRMLQRLLVHDIGLRDGTVDEKLSLVSFFLLFFGRT